jgi:hypothetical protein
MECIECKTTNPDGNRFCGQCGAEMGMTLDETVRRKGFRDRQATEMEITEAVIERLMKWGRWLGAIVALLVAFIAFGVGLIYRDTRAVLDAGKTQIESAVAEGKNNINSAVTQGKNDITDATKDIGVIRRNADDLGKQVGQLRSDINGYKEVNGEMKKLREQFHGQTADLSQLDLRVHTLETVGSPSDSGRGTQIGFKSVGCQPIPPDKDQSKVWYCVLGPPFVLYQRSSGVLRPVSSLSPVGFQDTSVGPKPACTVANRGTFYVEKGTGKETDKPLLCVRQQDGAYGWVQLSTP